MKRSNMTLLIAAAAFFVILLAFAVYLGLSAKRLIEEQGWVVLGPAIRSVPCYVCS